VSRLTVILSDFVNYFALLSHGERTPVTGDQVWSSLRGHRRLARTARKKILKRQISEDAQVKQDELLTRNRHRPRPPGAPGPLETGQDVYHKRCSTLRRYHRRLFDVPSDA
jgi:hypothetical protein